MRPVGRSVLAVLLTGLAAVAACEATRPSAAPPSPPSSAPSSEPSAGPSAAASAAVPASPVPTVDPALLGPLVGPWRSEPVPVPPGLASRADERCRGNMGPDVPSGAVMRAIDARGDGLLLVVYASPTGAWADCVPLFVDATGIVSGERAHAVSPGSLDRLGTLEIEFVSFTWSGTAPITASYLVGTAGEGVARIEIRSPGRPSIVASLANGWWAAWTPGRMPTTWRIVALDALGREVGTIEGVPQVGA